MLIFCVLQLWLCPSLWVQAAADDGTFEINGSILYGYFGHNPEVIIPHEVTIIDAYAFSGNLMIRSVQMHNRITRIGQGAFSGCSKLEAVTLSSSLQELPTEAFAGTALTSLAVPGGVTQIKAKAVCNLVSAQCKILLPNPKIQLETASIIGSSTCQITLVGTSDSTAASYAANNHLNFLSTDFTTLADKTTQTTHRQTKASGVSSHLSGQNADATTHSISTGGADVSHGQLNDPTQTNTDSTEHTRISSDCAPFDTQALRSTANTAVAANADSIHPFAWAELWWVALAGVCLGGLGCGVWLHLRTPRKKQVDPTPSSKKSSHWDDHGSA